MLNANTRQFLILKIILELPLSGGTFPSYEFNVLKVVRYLTNADVAKFAVAEIILCIMFFVSMYSEVLQVKI